MPDYESMNTEELEAARQRLMNERLSVAAEQDLVVSIINARNAKEAAAQKYAAMGDTEKKEMAQLIMGAGGIKSEERVGTP